MKTHERIIAVSVLALSLLCYGSGLVALVGRPGPPVAVGALELDARIAGVPSLLALAGAAVWAGARALREGAGKGAGAWTALLATVGGLGFTLSTAGSSRWPLVTGPLAALSVALSNPPLAASAWIVAGGGAQAVVCWAVGAPILAEALLVTTAIVAAGTYLVGRGVQDWREQEKVFEQSKWAASQYALANVRLQDEMGRNEVWTRAAERDRIAREIHDAVGYALTAALVQINAAQEELRTKRSTLGSRLGSLESLIRTTIGDVRREIRNLRETGSEDWIPRCRKLCTVFADCTGIRVNFRPSAQLDAIDDRTGENLYRILQEALTNAFRHGRADYVDVALGVHDGRLVFRVSDNGRGCGELQPGNGLRGIRERVGSLGGEVAWQSRPRRGFDLGITIPWHAGAGEP